MSHRGGVGGRRQAAGGGTGGGGGIWLREGGGGAATATPGVGWGGGVCREWEVRRAGRQGRDLRVGRGCGALGRPLVNSAYGAGPPAFGEGAEWSAGTFIGLLGRRWGQGSRGGATRWAGGTGSRVVAEPRSEQRGGAERGRGGRAGEEGRGLGGGGGLRAEPGLSMVLALW